MNSIKDLKRQRDQEIVANISHSITKTMEEMI
jgi:hypothetical protein